jgi:hypothetical protein
MYKFICIKTTKPNHYLIRNGNKLNHKLIPILDPKFNLREVAKQCILFEEHLNQ